MSEHSYDPAFDDTRDSGRRAPPRSVSRVVEPVVETHVETGSGADDPGRTRLGVTLSREQREWVEKESRRRGVPKAAVVRDLIAHAYGGGVPPSGAARGAVTVDDFGDPVDPLRPPPTVVADPVVSARESAPRFRRQAPTVEHRVEPSRLHDLPPGVGGARDTVPGPHGGNGHAHAPERDPRLSAAYAHLPEAVGAPVLPMDGEIPSGGIPSAATVGMGVDGNVFGGVYPRASSATARTPTTARQRQRHRRPVASPSALRPEPTSAAAAELEHRSRRSPPERRRVLAQQLAAERPGRPRPTPPRTGATSTAAGTLTSPSGDFPVTRQGKLTPWRH